MSAVKLLMTWDILPGREEEYFEFHIQKFVPALEKLGLNLSEAWLTVYADGDQPRMMAEARMASIAAAQQILRSSGWDDLGYQLEDYVENFDYKLVPAHGGFQI